MTLATPSHVILTPVTPADRPAYDTLYEASFPVSERKDLDSLLTGAHADHYRVLVARTPDRPVAGMVITATHGDLVMLDYLAVHPDLRGQGLGHAILPLAKAQCPDKHFFLEIEYPTEDCDNLPERVRRKHFYLSAGLAETGIRARIYGTVMELLAYPEDIPHVTLDGYADLVKALFPPNMRVEKVNP